MIVQCLPCSHLILTTGSSTNFASFKIFVPCNIKDQSKLTQFEKNFTKMNQFLKGKWVQV